MIRRPTIENSFPAYLEAVRDSTFAGLMTTRPVWDGKCRYCAQDVRLDEPYWDWLFNERYGLWMHLDCAETWLRRATKALKEFTRD